jgi:hypothetical protein
MIVERKRYPVTNKIPSKIDEIIKPFFVHFLLFLLCDKQ